MESSRRQNPTSKAHRPLQEVDFRFNIHRFGFLFSVPTQRYLKDLKTYLSLDISFFEIFPPSASSCHLKNVLDWNSPNKFSFENSRSGNRSDIGPAMARTIRMHPLDPQRSPGTYGKLPGSIWNFGDTMSGVTCCAPPPHPCGWRISNKGGGPEDMS